VVRVNVGFGVIVMVRVRMRISDNSVVVTVDLTTLVHGDICVCTSITFGIRVLECLEWPVRERPVGVITLR
jgi:hypothetical protein